MTNQSNACCSNLREYTLSYWKTHTQNVQWFESQKVSKKKPKKCEMRANKLARIQVNAENDVTNTMMRYQRICGWKCLLWMKKLRLKAKMFRPKGKCKLFDPNHLFNTYLNSASDFVWFFTKLGPPTHLKCSYLIYRLSLLGLIKLFVRSND